MTDLIDFDHQPADTLKVGDRVRVVVGKPAQGIVNGMEGTIVKIPGESIVNSIVGVDLSENFSYTGDNPAMIFRYRVAKIPSRKGNDWI